VSKTIVAQQGDCLINLSRQEGFLWETIWNHPGNAALRQRRNQLNIIKKGDQVFIPDLTLKELTKPTDQLHRFVRKGLTAKFTLTLFDRGKPRANQSYILTVSGKSRTGQTDNNGMLSESIPPDATEGLLLLGEKQEEITLNFGYIDPIEETSGVKSRLRNLGFYDGEVDDELTPETVAAIAEFQRSVNLSGEGEIDGQTRDMLVAVHGS
jgi:hypothetical protein